MISPQLSVLVVIGFAEALSAPEVAWSLVDAGFDVVAFARRGRRCGLRHSSLVQVLDITAPEHDVAVAERELSSLLDALAGDGARRCVLLPLDDTSVWLSDRVRPNSTWTYAGPTGLAAELALDKHRQIERARSTGFNVPASTFTRTRAERDDMQLEYPVIMRPAAAVAPGDNRLGKGRNWICSDAAEFARASAATPDGDLMVIQPYLDGGGEGVFGLATANGVVAWSAHRRVRMMNPHGSGSSACASQDAPDEIKGAIEAFLRTCNWRGMFMIELLRDASGQLWFVEFNGRAWGSMALCRRQGLEYPAWTVMLALDPGFVPTLPAGATGDLVCRNLGREIMHLLFVMRGPQSKAVHGWPRFWPTLAGLLRPGRTTRYYNWRKSEWRVFLADSWYTLRDQIFKSR